MLIKLCGIKTKNNVKDLQNIPLDMVGLNFYPNSIRYVEDSPAMTKLMDTIPKRIQKVGVFVNEDIEEILWRICSFDLDIVQLHGAESPEYCKKIKAEIKVIKVFSVGKEFDFSACQPYEAECDYFLFDTQSEDHGGSGKQFDWQLMKAYPLKTPYFLSGGISLADVDRIKSIDDDRCVGVDINSQFEFAPANKNMSNVFDFVKALKK
jgi:phosphoribosylanthranilate isomerase